MIKRKLMVVGFLLSAVALHGADTQCDNPDKLLNHEVRTFFDRPYKQKMLEHFEHTYSSRNLLFFAANDRLDPQLFGSHISENARLFIQEMQEKVAERLGGLKQNNYGDIQKVLGHISKHAAYICRLCCELDLKKRDGSFLGSVIVAHTRFWIWPYQFVDAEKVHAFCCTKFYKDMSLTEIQALFEAVK